MGALHFDEAETPFGNIIIVWAGEPEPRVIRVLLPTQVGALKSPFPHATRSRSEKVSRLVEDIALLVILMIIS
jgi:hypothetical protein